MGSKQVTDDGKKASLVIEAARTNAPEIARRRRGQCLALGLKNVPAEDALAEGVLLDAAALERQREALRAAEAELATELGDDAAVLERRDRHAAKVREALVEFRDSVQSNCGEAAVREVGFNGHTPRDPAALEDLGRAVIAGVAKKPPKATKRGVTFNAKAAIEGLDREVDALAAANNDVRREKREEQLARARRDEAWRAFERELSATAARLGATLRQVGLDDVADRLVPSARSSGGSAEEPAPPAPQPA